MKLTEEQLYDMTLGLLNQSFERLDELEKALSFYADQTNYDAHSLWEEPPCGVLEDGGKLAREVLERVDLKE